MGIEPQPPGSLAHVRCFPVPPGSPVPVGNGAVFICVPVRALRDDCEIGSLSPPLFRPGSNVVNFTGFLKPCLRKAGIQSHGLARSCEQGPLAAWTAPLSLVAVRGELSLSQVPRAADFHPALNQTCSSSWSAPSLPESRADRQPPQHGHLVWCLIGQASGVVSSHGQGRAQSAQGLLLLWVCSITACASETP